MNTTDEDVERYLKLFTLLDFDEINTITSQHKKDPSVRYGQQQLARYVVTTVFGTKAADQAILITETLFGNKDKIEAIKQMSADDISALQCATGGITVSGEQKILDLCTQS